MDEKEKIKVSIILPVYNGEQYLRESIDSCLAQTYSNIELIIVDDCSLDKTPEIIKSYSDHRIKYIRNTENQRLPRSLNIGFAESTGQYLTWTSDDNQYLPMAIEEMVNFLNTNTHVDFVYTDMDVLDLKTNKKVFKSCSHLTFYFENIIGACYLYTRRVYETIGEFDPRFEWIEDYDYWLRVEKKFAMRHLVKTLYLYGNHPQSLTNLKLYSIDLLAYLSRFYHGYLSFDGLTEGIGRYIVKFPLFKKESWSVWFPIIQKVTHLNIQLQIAFWGGITCALFKKTITVISLFWGKFIALFNKAPSFTKVLSSLIPGDNGKIQVLCCIPFLTMGGSEKVIKDTVRGLSSKGYDFHLFCFNQDKGPWVDDFLSNFKNYAGIVPIYDIDVYTDYLIQIIRKLNIKMILLTNTHETYKSLKKVREIFPEIKVVDVIHLENVGGTHQHISTIGAPYVDRRVCISQHLLEYMEEKYKVWGLSSELASRLKVIHNGTNLVEFSREKITSGKFRKQYQIPNGKKIISFVARMANEKNPFVFVDVARGILEKKPHTPLHFVMGGDGPLFDNLKSKIKDYGLENYFTLPGTVTNVGELLSDSFLFISVSTHEGIPLSIQESMFMNVPVISTNVGAIDEIVKDGSNGFLIPRDENLVDCVINRVGYLLDHEKEYQNMALKSREDAYLGFTMEMMCRGYEDLFSAVLGSNKNKVKVSG